MLVAFDKQIRNVRLKGLKLDPQEADFTCFLVDDLVFLHGETLNKQPLLLKSFFALLCHLKTVTAVWIIFFFERIRMLISLSDYFRFRQFRAIL